MERHECKLCMRSFSNGRALGGHMRSHMMNLPIDSKDLEEEEEATHDDQMLIDEVDPVTASSSDEQEEDEAEEEVDEEGLYYGLRENPKRSIRLVDPEFSFAVDAGCVVLQDRESETESSKNPTRRRSKRTRKSAMLDHHHRQQLHNQYHHHQEDLKKLKLKTKMDSWANHVEPEPVSSISDATAEEDVAFCLMMLSRDKWKKQDKQQREEQDDQDEEEDDEAEYRSLDVDSDESEEQPIKLQRTKSSRGKYKCDTCNKVFKSYQALGGHKASHKKIKAAAAANHNQNRIVYEPEHGQEFKNNAGGSSYVKTHECPVCFRVFASGQALGGHKRSHVIGSAVINNNTHYHSPPLKRFAKQSDMIDLNLPAPVEDDDVSQIELSAVSDAEFVIPIRR